MARDNVGSCTVPLHDLCPVVMDILLVCTFVAGSSLEKLSTGRLIGGVMQSNRQTGKIRSWGSYIALTGACVCVCLSFGVCEQAVRCIYAIWAERGRRDDSFRNARGRATSTDIQEVGGHRRGQPCTA